jgi:hypothetical protein
MGYPAKTVTKHTNTQRCEFPRILTLRDGQFILRVTESSRVSSLQFQQPIPGKHFGEYGDCAMGQIVVLGVLR